MRRAMHSRPCSGDVNWCSWRSDSCTSCCIPSRSCIATRCSVCCCYRCGGRRLAPSAWWRSWVSWSQRWCRSPGALSDGGTLDRPASSSDATSERDVAADVFATGSLTAVVSHNTRRFARVALDVRALGPLPYFVLGFYLGRRRILETLADHIATVRRARWPLLAAGVLVQAVAIGAMVAASPAARPVVGSLLPSAVRLGGGLVGLFYASVIILVAQRVGWDRRLAPFAAVGRLALTSYLLQTVVVTTLLYGYGFGLYGQIREAACLVLLVVIYVANVALATWWLRRFRMGPVEWLWRCASYGRWQPLRS